MVATVTIRGIEATVKHINEVANGLTGQGLIAPMRKATLLVTKEAKELAPVDTGRLRSSIAPEVRPFGNSIEGVVGTAVKYGPAMELGTDPHFVPLADLEVWARRHNVSARAVQSAIARHGTKPRWFLRTAVENNEADVKQIFDDYVSGLVK